MSPSFDNFLEMCSIKILCHSDDIAPEGAIFYPKGGNCFARIGDDRLWFKLISYVDDSHLFVLADEYFNYYHSHSTKSVH